MGVSAERSETFLFFSCVGRAGSFPQHFVRCKTGNPPTVCSLSIQIRTGHSQSRIRVVQRCAKDIPLPTLGECGPHVEAGPHHFFTTFFYGTCQLAQPIFPKNQNTQWGVKSSSPCRSWPPGPLSRLRHFGRAQRFLGGGGFARICSRPAFLFERVHLEISI